MVGEVLAIQLVQRVEPHNIERPVRDESVDSPEPRWITLFLARKPKLPRIISPGLFSRGIDMRKPLGFVRLRPSDWVPMLFGGGLFELVHREGLVSLNFLEYRDEELSRTLPDGKPLMIHLKVAERKVQSPLVCGDLRDFDIELSFLTLFYHSPGYRKTPSSTQG